MRRLLTAAALAAVLMTGAACTDPSGTPGAGGSPSGGAGSSGGTGSTSGATPTFSVSAADVKVCEDTRNLVTDSTKRFGEEVVRSLQGGGEQAAVAAVKTLFTDWANGLRVQAGKAADPDLRNALLQYASGLEKLNAEVKTVADLAKLQDLNTPELTAATEKVQQICG